MRRGLATVAGLAAPVAAIVVLAAVSSGSSHAATPATNPGPDPSASPAAIVDLRPPGGGTPLKTAADATALALRDTQEIASATSTQVVSTTYGSLMKPGAAGSSLETVPTGFTADQAVWAVGVQGKYQPQFANGRTYDWGVLIYDPLTGASLGSLAGNGTLPAPFEK